jgi:hypothetical protein
MYSLAGSIVPHSRWRLQEQYQAEVVIEKAEAPAAIIISSQTRGDDDLPAPFDRQGKDISCSVTASRESEGATGCR